jgi:tetratricopeptide (TPR) repeat protein
MMRQFFTLITAIALFSLGALAAAQDATPTPLPEEPPPTCPAFPGESRETRVGYYMGEGITYLGNNQLSQAKNSFACIVRVIDPSYVPGWMGRARVNTRLVEYERAFADLNRAVQLAPNLPAAYNDRGYIFMQWRDYPRARADFERALDIDPGYTPAFSNLAVAYMVQGQYDQAIALLEDKINETNIDGILDQLRAPDYDPNRPILFDPTHARLYALLGIVYERRALSNFQNYTELFNRTNQFPDDRIAQTAGALESRFTFELRLDDGSWLLLSAYPADAGA